MPKNITLFLCLISLLCFFLPKQINKEIPTITPTNTTTTIFIALFPINQLHKVETPLFTISSYEIMTNPKYSSLARQIHANIEGGKLFGYSEEVMDTLMKLRGELEITPEKIALIYCQLSPNQSIELAEKYIQNLGGSILEVKSIQLH